MAPDQLVSDFELQLIAPACHPGSVAYCAKAQLRDDITEVLPYLNAELKGADYNHQAKVLLWKSPGRKYAVRPREISLAPVESREEGLKLVGDFVGVINGIWRRRQEIEPDLTPRKVPALMDIFRLLPKSNCKECGHQTCLSFASALKGEKAELAQCPGLADQARESLLALIGAK